MTKKIKQQHGKKRIQSAIHRDKGESRKPTGPDKEAPESIDSSSGIPVVGIGGSAGALEPFKTFFTAMPPDSGAAFVIIQHLSPTYQSMLTELLAQHTRMRVAEARDAMPIEPNCVYVIPPNQYLTVRGGVLYLVAPKKQDSIRMPIDFFFRSLAEDRQERAICILFSGAGSDGTLGVRAVRGAGGLAIAQDPQTAQFGDMPRSAIATGLEDFVLSPDQMPEALLNYLRHPYVRGGEPAAALEAEGKPGGLQDILALILSKRGADFRCYKKNTIVRRIERRMGLHRISDLPGYYKLLRQDTDEVNQLFKDLTADARAVARGADVIEREAQHADGSYYLVRLMPYRTQKGRLDGAVITFSNVTRLRLGEKKTRRLAAVVTDSNDAVLLFDLAGNILSWNRGAQKAYGWSEAEALQMTIHDMTPSDEIDDVTELIGVLAGKTAPSYETRRKTKDGRVLDIWLTATAVHDEAGKTVESIATTERDITDRKKVEEELRRLNEELTHKVLALDAANKELDAFIFSISHDLRAPLRHVSEFARLVMEDYFERLDEQGKDYLARIRQGAVKMSKLIEDLLYLSRISHQNIDRIKFNMSKRASQIVENLRKTSPGRDVDVSIQEGIAAFANPGLTDIVLSNLLENAWKFTSMTDNARIEFGALDRSFSLRNKNPLK